MESKRKPSPPALSHFAGEGDQESYSLLESNSGIGRFVLAVLCLVLVSLGCNLGQEIATSTPQIVTVVVTQIPPTVENTATTQSPTATTPPIAINSEATAFSKGEVLAPRTPTPTTRRVFIYLV